MGQVEDDSQLEPWLDEAIQLYRDEPNRRRLLWAVWEDGYLAGARAWAPAGSAPPAMNPFPLN